jgi:hypothetical protein
LVSAGYDAALGDEKVRLRVSETIYSLDMSSYFIIGYLFALPEEGASWVRKFEHLRYTLAYFITLDGV